jgi:hypothetical protein
VDDHTRLAYSEILGDERGATTAGFLLRATRFYAAHGIRVEALLTDNAWTYRYAHESRATAQRLGIHQLFTRPHRPQTNGKVERYNRTFLEEWAYVRLYRSNAKRARLLPPWLHRYNYHRSPHRARRPSTHRPSQQPIRELQLERVTSHQLRSDGVPSEDAGAQQRSEIRPTGTPVDNGAEPKGLVPHWTTRAGVRPPQRS